MLLLFVYFPYLTFTTALQRTLQQAPAKFFHPKTRPSHQQSRKRFIYPTFNDCIPKTPPINTSQIFQPLKTLPSSCFLYLTPPGPMHRLGRRLYNTDTAANHLITVLSIPIKYPTDFLPKMFSPMPTRSAIYIQVCNVHAIIYRPIK